jgi:2-haloacid dehalogenase
LWFARLLRDGFALAAMGSYRPFADLAADALYGLEPQLEEDQVAGVLDALGRLEPHPDVEAGLLREAGPAAATLTNSNTEVGIRCRCALTAVARISEYRQLRNPAIPRRLHPGRKP